MKRTFYIYAPHLPLFEALVLPVLNTAAVEVTGFSDVGALRETALKAGTPEGVLVAFAGGLPAAPAVVYDAARDLGLHVWHVSDSYAQAKAGTHPDVEALEVAGEGDSAGIRPAEDRAAAQGMVSSAAIDRGSKPQEPEEA